MKKNYLILGMGLFSFALLTVSFLTPEKAYASTDVIATGTATSATPRPCPSHNNACNNSDGCDSSLNDLGFWVHWIGMERADDSSVDTQFLPCKDRYSEVTSGGSCTKGSYQTELKEYGCGSNP